MPVFIPLIGAFILSASLTYKTSKNAKNKFEKRRKRLRE